jgi:multidrug efflux system membrane fusion protein
MRRHRARWWFWAAEALVVAAAALAVASVKLNATARVTAQGRRGPAVPPPTPVAVTTAQRRDVGVYRAGLGTVTPLRTVTVRTRVDGELVRVAYREGEIVTAGQLLAELDPRPFTVQLAQAQGLLTRDRALLENAQVDLRRYQALIAEEAIPRQQLDTQRALVRQYEGAVANDEGQVAAAKLNLDYCRITAPMAGRVGLRPVDPGNIVHATDTTGLVVITQLEPITVVFALPEDDLDAVLTRLHGGSALAVEAYDREQQRLLATGSLLTIDNVIDPTTGTVRLKATFANAHHELFPSQFVNARLRLEVRRGAVVVPVTAIQRSTRGTFAFVVRPDQTVTRRSVRTGVGEGDLVIVEQGIAEGESVVVEGADRLQEGSRVTVAAGTAP